MSQEDEAGDRRYDCSTCPALERALRACPRWPPPELNQLAELRPEVAEDSPDDFWRRLKVANWRADNGELKLAGLLQEAINHSRLSRSTESTCPRYGIPGWTMSLLHLYHRTQAMSGALGGAMVVSECPGLEDVRVSHAFSVIGSEYRRLKKENTDGND